MNYIVKNENAIYYECGYSCDNALFIKLGSQGYFITDGRYFQEAKDLLEPEVAVIQSGNLIQSARQLLRQNRIRSLVYDPKQWELESFKNLKRYSISYKPKVDFSWKKRAIKSDEEIALIKQAVTLGDRAFDRFADEVKTGACEYELNFLAKKCLSDVGRYDLSFTPIVAINANASKPHATPTSTQLQMGDLLLMDAGLKYKRYCSDKTRTAYFHHGVSFEYAQSFHSQKIQKAYNTVLKAHDVAIEKARVGMKASQIDALARDVIEKAGFGKYFVHSTGHGVGLDIHEMPFISTRSQMVIEPNMVYTVEPGIYIPGEFGIRIEDMVVMGQQRAQVL